MLVIANVRYGSREVPGAEAAAGRIAAACREAGMHVTDRADLTAADILGAVGEFADRTTTNGVAIVYFTGRGGPSLVNGRSEACVHGAGKADDAAARSKGAVPINAILKTLRERSSSRLLCLLVDGCGEDPDSPQVPPPGPVADLDLADDAVVCLAVASGRGATGAEGDAPTPFAAALADEIKLAGTSVGKWLDAARRSVEQRTRGGLEIAMRHGGKELEAIARVAVASEPGFRDAAEAAPGDRPGQGWANGAGMVFSWCPPGSFTMGEPDAARADGGDATPVDVTLTVGFWMGRHEVTQQEYRRITGRSGGTTQVAASTWYEARTGVVHRNAPITPVSWHRDMKKFVESLNTGERKAGRLPDGWTYGLPTEVEWEYACRAGGRGGYAFGDDPGRLHLHGNYADRRLFDESAGLYWYAARDFDDGAGAHPVPVGGYLPNAWGLYDMHGNVAELCADAYGESLQGGIDPAPVAPPKKEWWPGVIRGGSWCSSLEYCRAGFRNTAITYGNASPDSFVGMRIVLRRTQEATP